MDAFIARSVYKGSEIYYWETDSRALGIRFLSST